ncbi:MAG: signal peptidase I [Desulfovibrionaceae bacterium]
MTDFKNLRDNSPKEKSLLREYAEALVVALLLAMVIRTFVVQAFKIPSESMLETLLVGDHLLVNKFSYGVKWPFSNTYAVDGPDPVRGDIIVFEYPNNPSLDYIKRIVGIPGDVMEVRDKQLYRNGQAVQEAYIRHTEPKRIERIRDNFGPVTVPQGKYFVMGDNRDNSQDSRFWGFVEKSAIRGKAWRIYWSSEGLGNVRWERFGKAVE